MTISDEYNIQLLVSLYRSELLIEMELCKSLQRIDTTCVILYLLKHSIYDNMFGCVLGIIPQTRDNRSLGSSYAIKDCTCIIFIYIDFRSSLRDFTLCGSHFTLINLSFSCAGFDFFSGITHHSIAVTGVDSPSAAESFLDVGWVVFVHVGIVSIF